MELIGRLKDEHAWIRREMGAVEESLAGEGFDQVDELRERLRALWTFLLRHERLEEKWMEGGWSDQPRPLPDTERDKAHRDHESIMAVLDSLGGLLARFDGFSHGGPMPLDERKVVRATIEGLFRFVREHLDREDKEILNDFRAGRRPAAQI